MPAQSKIRIRVPATTANLGPGFDCLGMALNLWNEVIVEPADRTMVMVNGEGADKLARDESNLIFQTIQGSYRKRGQKAPGFKIECINRIPLARGLGSSAAAIVAGLLAANYFMGGFGRTRKTDILQEAAAIEGHGDNVAPAIFGGCQIVFKDGDRFLQSRIYLPPLPRKAVLFIPDLEIATARARQVMPAAVPLAHAVYNLSRVALLVKSLSFGPGSLLKWGTQDRLHQPYRQAIYPAMERIFRAAMSAGASGVFLSGSGSTILALCDESSAAVGRAMLQAGRREGLQARIVVTRPVEKGAEVKEIGDRR